MTSLRTDAVSRPADAGSGATGAIFGVLIAALVVLGGYVVFLRSGSDDGSSSEPTITVLETESPSPGDSSQTTTPDPPDEYNFAGDWGGDVEGDVSEYSVDASLSDNGTVLHGAVAYPELDCFGSWTQVSRDGNVVNVHEVITEGDRCYAEVDITLTLIDDGHLGFAIFDGTTNRPHATLTRED